MNISNMKTNLPVQNIQSGSNTPSKTADVTRDSNGQATQQPRVVDMKNISLNEINELIRSGVDGLLEMVPFISPLTVNQYGKEYAANIKIDFLAQVEGSIEFKRSIGKDTTLIEKVLDKLKSLDGTKMPENIDIFT